MKMPGNQLAFVILDNGHKIAIRCIDPGHLVFSEGLIPPYNIIRSYCEGDELKASGWKFSEGKWYCPEHSHHLTDEKNGE